MNPIIVPDTTDQHYSGWIIIMNNAEAQLYGGTSPVGDIEHISTFVNAAGRLSESDLNSDREGRAFDSHGSGRHAMEVTSTYEIEVSRFVAVLGEAFNSSAEKQSVNHIVVSAPPHLLGEVRANWPDALRKRVSCFLNRDLVNIPQSQIRAHLPNRLWSSIT